MYFHGQIVQMDQCVGLHGWLDAAAKRADQKGADMSFTLCMLVSSLVASMRDYVPHSVVVIVLRL